MKNYLLILGSIIVGVFFLNSCRKENPNNNYNTDVELVYDIIKNSGKNIELSKDEINQIIKDKHFPKIEYNLWDTTSICGNNLLRGYEEEQITNILRTNDLLTIPIVFHIMHDGGISNISESQVLNALDNLNEAFLPGNIEFCLATQGPDGNPHSGINRVNVSEIYSHYTTNGVTGGISSPWCSTSVRDDQMKDLSIWPKTFAYNVWIVNRIHSQSCTNTINGYAYIPTNSTIVGDYDGTVIRFDRLGGIEPEPLFNVWQNSGVLIHELGHGFNLYHTYHNTGSCADEINCNTQGDRVCDTPPTVEFAINSFCNPTPNTCPNMLYDNYMDNSYGCDLFFTEGQIDRMRTSMQGSIRGPLLNSNACNGVSCIWDLDGDGIIALSDLLILLSQWGNPYITEDLLLFLSQYGFICN